MQAAVAVGEGAAVAIEQDDARLRPQRACAVGIVAQASAAIESAR